MLKKIIIAFYAFYAQAGELASIDTEYPERCSICCDQMVCDIKSNVTLSCHTSHTFHKQCIERWLERKPVCPLCRTPTRKEKICILRGIGSNVISQLDQDVHARRNATPDEADITTSLAIGSGLFFILCTLYSYM